MPTQNVIRMGKPYLEQLVTRFSHKGTPLVYTASNIVVRELFWRRLGALLAHSRVAHRSRVLDFGGGNGILAPTLSNLYQEVTCIDLRTEMVTEVCTKHTLSNVTIISGELLAQKLPDACFDTIIAADVLEHIMDLDNLIREFERLLVHGGELLISVPSENCFYEFGRKVFGYTKPWDHYHDASFIEQMVSQYLPMETRNYFPINTPSLAVFSLGRFVKKDTTPRRMS